ncbi:MAG: GNAT family N-acetyltransferase [Coprobacillaceae bacterium]
MRIELREYTLDDAKALSAMANDYDVSKSLRDIFPYPYTEEDATKFLEFVTKLPPESGIEFAIMVDGEFAGAIGMTFSTDIYRKTAEIGYWLGKPYWQRGIIGNAIKMICTYTFENFPIHKITAEVFANNIASQKALEKNGFVLEGTCKEHVFKEEQYYDVKLYGICK